jgi:hypothetical protein
MKKRNLYYYMLLFSLGNILFCTNQKKEEQNDPYSIGKITEEKTPKEKMLEILNNMKKQINFVPDKIKAFFQGYYNNHQDKLKETVKVSRENPDVAINLIVFGAIAAVTIPLALKARKIIKTTLPGFSKILATRTMTSFYFLGGGYYFYNKYNNQFNEFLKETAPKKDLLDVATTNKDSSLQENLNKKDEHDNKIEQLLNNISNNEKELKEPKEKDPKKKK